ncbi:MAG: hypothetical protein NZ849_09115 [Meiothermus sp.]|uniref:transaldolase family protein n=1 Tax=Meiothermus sp. TaxID=1955249 RepID=UPI0025EB7088|nr:transaldolase family protein [Meiothermus sp.]MCS7057490.1 hypothetical protein [Meiothermus sp.]MCS7195050.1 hypothetical protein [Meiothermus sp.]MCX7739588.1 hypothetical protein [Meiothermus sp.]MDW8090842.1 transaldolase family protein [Meiothermus sp.]MDW8482463.1 transaldolase family protein [Meiothermus sp.]
MRLYLDSARLSELQPLLGSGVFHGVTTNPLLLQEAGLGAAGLPGFARAVFQAGAKEVYLQAWGTSAEVLYRCGLSLAGLDGRVVVKLPATWEGLSAAGRLVLEGVRVCITAAYLPHQALLASAVGADFVAPYLGRINDSGQDGYTTIGRMSDLLRGIGSKTEILAASVRSIADVVALAQRGVRHVTLPLQVAHRLFQEPLTLEAARQFERAMEEASL